MKQTLKKMAVLLSVALVCAPMGAMATEKLIVMDSETVAKKRFVVSDTNNTITVKDANEVDRMVVTNTGFIGIGPSTLAAPFTPSVALHAKGTATGSQFRAHYNGLTSSGGGTFVMMHNNGSSSALPTASNRIGAMYFGTEAVHPANNLLGSFYGAGITIYAEGDWSVTAGPPAPGSSVPTAAVVAPAVISMDTATGTEARAERLRISGKGVKVTGAVQIVPKGTKLCNVTYRGTIWVTQANAGLADTAEICVKLANDTYSWKALF